MGQEGDPDDEYGDDEDYPLDYPHSDPDYEPEDEEHGDRLDRLADERAAEVSP